MNELQRQHYLSAFGVDSYMPRWQLPFAAVSTLCELPIAEAGVPVFPKDDVNLEPVIVQHITQPVLGAVSQGASPANNLIGDILDSKKPDKPSRQPISAADILAQLDSKPVTIDSFSLSIWRPLDGVMIIESRNAKLALPTEVLLNNVLRSVFSNHAVKPQEEILRWPMIENSFAKRTADDARIELQTWLSVQHEIRPIRQLWLMGANAAIYLLPQSVSYEDSLFQVQNLEEPSMAAFILPSLSELLQKAVDKKKFFTAIHRYKLISQ